MTLKTVQFEVNVPCTAEVIGDNIRHALSLGLPAFDSAPIETLHVIANGPSARQAPLKELFTSASPTLALNGAIKLFIDQGVWPDYWCACDPQALVADFIPDIPPKFTTYLVGSKCHPSVFARLKDRTVRLWHVSDHEATKDHRPIPTASSVTLTALSLMRRVLGFRRFETWGWDGCYLGGLHHATQAPREPQEADITLMIGSTMDETGKPSGGVPFATSHTWALEAQDAVLQMHRADYEVVIHGEGMIGALLRSLKG